MSGKDQSCDAQICILRPNQQSVNQVIPPELDWHINRYMAATAIQEAVERAIVQDFLGAQRQLNEVIQSIQNSKSAQMDSEYRGRTEDLTKDLKECANGMDHTTFSSGMHYAHAYSTMYYMERSTGTNNLLGVNKLLNVGTATLNNNQSPQQLHNNTQLQQNNNHSDNKRNRGYGYLTNAQQEEVLKAKQNVKFYVTSYTENALY